MSLLPKTKQNVPVQPSYVTLNKDGKPVWEPGLRAEVTSRRRHPVKRKVDEALEAPVACDLKATLKMSPEARAGWLEKALAAIPKGRAKPQDVFDIVTHRKFVSGIPEELGQKMLKIVKESLMFFSEKQQLNIAKCKLVKEFKTSDPSRRKRRLHDGEDDDSDERSTDDEGGGVGRRHFAEADGGGRGGDDDRRRDELLESRGGGDGSGDHAPMDRDREESMPPMPDLSAEERARIEREFAERERERQRKREEELRRLETERKAHEEREKQRKAKIGSAFLVGGEDEEEDIPSSGILRQPVVEKKAEDRIRPEDEGGLSYGLRLPIVSASGSGLLVTSAASTSAIQTMGGDSIVTEAQQILQRGAGAFLDKSPPRREGTRSRSRRRRSRSRGGGGRRRSRSRSRSERGGGGGGGGGGERARGRQPKVEDRRRRVYDSLRSPTPDGHLRGQMRAARKAKMMAQMIRQGNVPRVS